MDRNHVKSDNDIGTLSFCRSDVDGHVTRPWLERDEVFAVGNQLEGRYLLQSRLGEGGMGSVFLARDERLDRNVAIKVLLLTRDVREAEKELETEARLGANLQHPNIASVFDFGFHRNHSFTVFEYVDGESLRALLERRGC